MSKIIYPVVAILVAAFVLLASLTWARQNKSRPKLISPTPRQIWQIRSIDTVKYSRDLARLDANNSNFDAVINSQVKAIAGTGANYVAIGTPYDNEFVPFLRKWVDAARKYNLHVWFRGNFSGWEGWFDYPSISRSDHEEMLKKFITSNPDLFANGDIFTSCTECENGGPGDPRDNGDVSGQRQFLIDEYHLANDAFTQIGKKVNANYFSMNYDVAKMVMDPATTQALGGIVVIDHYVDTPQTFAATIKDLEASSGGKVMIGEMGVPLPEVNGDMTEAQQADWIDSALALIKSDPNVIGVNYWTGFGGSTRLWRDDGTATTAAGVILKYYNP